MTDDQQSEADSMRVLGHSAREHWRVNADWVDVTRPQAPIRVAALEALPQNLRLDLNQTALVIVDMQNDFCSPGGWLDHIGVDFAPARGPIEPLNRLLPQLRREQVPIIWVNWGNRPDFLNISPGLFHVYDPDGASVGLGQRVPASGSRVLEKGQWGAAIVDELDVDQNDIRVDKYRMSGFWDTPLNSILTQLGTRTLLFAGVNADQCVLHTLADANFLGYDCVLLSDCSATSSPAFCWDATIFNVRTIFGFTADSNDFSTALQHSTSGHLGDPR